VLVTLSDLQLCNITFSKTIRKATLLGWLFVRSAFISALIFCMIGL